MHRNLIDYTPSQLSFSHAFLAMLFYLFFTCFLFSCVSLDPREKPDFGNKGLTNCDPLLASAALSAEYVQDIYASNFLLTRIAEEFIKQKQIDNTKEILRRAVLLIKKPAAAPFRYQLQIELSRFFINFDEIATARQMLQEALDQALTLTNEDMRGSALQSIIEQAFLTQDIFPDILRSAIDYVYVLQDPIKRVDLLVKLGKKYQDLNVRNRADSLVQQAIAAASSINNPWAKARSYVLIARRFIADSDKENADQYIAMAMQVINASDVLAISANDAEILLDLIVNLADAGHLNDASKTIPILPNEQLKVTAQLALIERSITQKSNLYSIMYLPRLRNQLRLQDPDSKNELSLSSLIRLSEIFQASGLNSESIRYTQEAMPYLSSPLVTNISTYRSRLALVLAKNNMVEEAIASAGLIPDSWVGSQTLRQIAELLFQHPELITKNRAISMRALLIEAEMLASKATYLRESALADVAASSFRIGDDVRAVRILQDISDNYLLGKTLVDAASSRPTVSNLNPDARVKLQALWKRWLSKTPSTR